MTDYWKSYAKKFCEICKCWYADNKISAERHELGARHKVMVQQRIRDSAKKAKNKELKVLFLNRFLVILKFFLVKYLAFKNFFVETRWDQPKRFYTSDEYAKKYNEIAAHIATKNQSLINSGTVSSDFECTQAIAPTFAPQIMPTSSEAKITRERPIKKEQLGKQKKRRWDITEDPKVPEELIKIEPKPELIVTSEIANSTLEDFKGHPYGPWVPVKKEIPKPEPIKRPEKPKKHYDDLPEQNYGPGTSTVIPEELLEVASIDPEEFEFKQKQLPEQKKNVKNAVGFRRPGNSGNKSFRNNKAN
ncbi:WW domain-containing protein [Meloidogyne graminicola]|uniref:WW domain-containing protein n=1 Tax=Meloidogyne graminicola TaxID=189291 RepID=A0A8S9ZUQ8_9BILA|nr:WW domain-containing protein [Meloidogyne graminicola]